MTQQDIINNLAYKIRNKKMQYAISNLIYNYYCSHHSPDDNLNNLNIIGLGEIVTSNQQLQEDPIGMDGEDMMNNEQFLLIKNSKTKVYFGFLLLPVDNDLDERHAFFPYGYPCFEEIGEGIKSKNNKIYGNILGEQVEINRLYFSKQMPFVGALSTYHKILNEVIYNENSNIDLDPLSKFEKKAQKIYDSNN